LLALTMTVLFGCDRQERAPAPTAEERERLDDAEAMLNGLSNEEGPEAEAASPSK
jgi:hypothetical protein